MKKGLGMIVMGAALMSDLNSPLDRNSKSDLRPEDIDVKPKEPVIPKGCKKYVFKESFGTLEVVAMNKKSAMKKYNKWYDANTLKPNTP